MILTVRHALGQYDISIGNGALDRLGEIAKGVASGQRAFVLTDENVRSLYGERALASLQSAGFSAHMGVLPAGEATKSLSMLGRVYSMLCEAKITRSDLIVALGGGVIGDLAGFAAATYLRGVAYVQVPTSLLAQVDSSVGGKTAVDLPEGKNLAGYFYQPKAVLIDPALLATLPRRVFYDGMGEVIKYGVAFDEALFEESARVSPQSDMTGIVARCVDLKRAVVERDERDTGERMLLNLGHTLGHAIEAAQHYEGLSHGEAVAAGMALMTRLGEQSKLTQPGTARRIEEVLRGMGLPVTVPAVLYGDMRRAMGSDKKHLDGGLRIVVPECVGRARIVLSPPSFFDGLEALLSPAP